MSRKLVGSIAVLAVAAAFSSSAATGVASAAPAKPAKAQGAKKPAKRNARRAEGRGGRIPAGRGPRGGVMYVKGTSTGKGPANAAECNQIAADLETAYVALEDYLIEGDEDRSEGMYDAIVDMEANGVKRGCSFS